MLKLLKEDFIETNKVNFVLYIVTFVSSLLVLISSNYKDSVDIFTATFVLCMGISTLSMLICLILPFVKSFLNNESIFKQDKNKIIKEKYDVKVITIILTIILSLLVLGLSFVNTYSKDNLLSFFKDLLINRSLSKSVLTFGIILFLKLLIIYLTSLLSRIVAEKKKNEKVLRTFIYSLIILISIYYLVSFLVRIIDYERKVVLKIIILIITNIILYICGKYFYNNTIEKKVRKLK